MPLNDPAKGRAFSEQMIVLAPKLADRTIFCPLYPTAEADGLYGALRKV